MPTKANNEQGISINARALRTLALGILAGLVAVLLFALQSSDVQEFVAVAATGMTYGSACLVVGALLGFLFGIPRSLQGDGQTEEPDGKPGAKERSASIGYRANTNLEQISDWLTKILVGVGLTQIGSLPSRLQQITGFVAPGLGGFRGAELFAMSLILFFVVTGFLFGYLWTRLNLGEALRRADEGAYRELKHQVEEAQREIEQFKTQAEHNENARKLVLQQLNPQQSPVPQQALSEAIAAASNSVKDEAWRRAEQLRRENWQTAATKLVMQRATPIFIALRDNDPEKSIHFNFGQLGFALKDQLNPDIIGAFQALDEAIAIRDRTKRSGSDEWGWCSYEFNRAICRIALDSDFKAKVKSVPEVKAVIIKDLKTALTGDPKIYAARIASDGKIADWMALNDVTMEDLKST